MLPQLFYLALTIPTAAGLVTQRGHACLVYPESSNDGTPSDDTPNILLAFEKCGKDASIVFTEGTFHIKQVMNTTNLVNCNVSLYGEMIWSSDLPYWLSHSIDVVYQNQSTAWLFGGTNVTFRGHGRGKFNGQGTSIPQHLSIGKAEMINA